MPSSTKNRSLMSYLAQLELAWLASGQSFWVRSWEISLRYLRQAIVSAGPTGAGASYWRDSLRSLGRHYFSEIALVPFLAAERFCAELDEFDIPAGEKTMYFIDEKEGKLVEDEKHGKPVTLPVRIRDAAQGLAIYAVSINDAQAILDKLVQEILGENRENPFIALDIGRGRTPLEIFVVHYREGDLGTHNELGVSLFVTPRDDPSAGPGRYIVELPVNQSFTRAAGGIWGYPKTMADLKFEYEENKVHFTFLRREGDGAKGADLPVLTITFPRGGSGSSTAIPFYSYTLLNRKPHQTLFMRSGRGERVRAGSGHVGLNIGDAEQDSLCKMLHDLGLSEKRPIVEGWTEHMSGEFGVPRALQ